MIGIKSRINFMLTKTQIKKLAPLIKEIEEMAKLKEPGMLLAQILLINDESAVLKAGIIDNETGQNIQKVMGHYTKEEIDMIPIW